MANAGEDELPAKYGSLKNTSVKTSLRPVIEPSLSSSSTMLFVERALEEEEEDSDVPDEDPPAYLTITKSKSFDELALARKGSTPSSPLTRKPSPAEGKKRRDNGSKSKGASLKSLPSALFNDFIGRQVRVEKKERSQSIKPSGMDKDRKVTVKVLEAKGLPGRKARAKATKQASNLLKKSSAFIMEVSSPNIMVIEKVSADPYATVTIEDENFRTRTIFSKLNPFWCEEFSCDVEDPDTAMIKVVVWDANKYERDEPIGKLYIPMNALADQDAHENWYPLFPLTSKEVLSSAQVVSGTKAVSLTTSAPEENKKSAHDFKLGSVRLRMQYAEEIILPSSEYEELRAILMEDEILVIKLLNKVITERETVAGILMRIFQAHGKALRLIKKLTGDEITSTRNPTVIFRGNSIATKALDLYMKYIGHGYLDKVLGDTIRKLYSTKKSCEINPTKLEKGDDVKKNLKNLIQVCSKIADSVFTSLPSCPPEFREVFHHIQEKVKESYEEEEVRVTKYTAVSGFIFLRFFCPAILAPKLFNLTDEHPDVSTSRTLILIGKVLQNIANLVEFSGDKEPYMASMNPFLVDNLPKMKQFLDSLSSPRVLETEIPRTTKVPEVNECKELASIFRYLKRNQLDMEEAATSPEERSTMEELTAILLKLQKTEDHIRANAG
eukprot:TRINITY_DN1376_c0_g1_i1.p1 TRINITY_DN1376_c0_g1~~TRINITY_DN1376_c0_g1_i1.p1  ORF type:complete len:668 (+),score=157.12 TRINITY_DN1376_c0_g1_i1:64-2067(+)